MHTGYLDTPFLKTGLWRRPLIVRLKGSAKTAPKEVFLEDFLVFILLKESVKNLFKNSPPSSVSIKFGFLFELIRIFSKEPSIIMAIFFQCYWPTKFWEIVYDN